MADVQKGASDYEGALKSYEEALRICTLHYPQDNSFFVFTQFRLGTMHKRLGHYAQATEILEKSNNSYRAHLKHEKERWSWNLMHLGELYLSVGKIDLAKAHILEGCNIRKDQNHPVHIAWGNVHLAQVKIAEGFYQEAIDILKACFKIYEEAYKNKNHIRFAWMAHHLANAYKFSGKAEEARKWYQYSLSICYEKYGKTHIETAFLLCDFGCFLLLQNELDEAKTKLQSALAIFQNENHPEAYRCLEYLGDLQIVEKNQKKANHYYAQALSIAQLYFEKKLQAY